MVERTIIIGRHAGSGFAAAPELRSAGTAAAEGAAEQRTHNVPINGPVEGVGASEYRETLGSAGFGNNNGEGLSPAALSFASRAPKAALPTTATHRPNSRGSHQSGHRLPVPLPAQRCRGTCRHRHPTCRPEFGIAALRPFRRESRHSGRCPLVINPASCALVRRTDLSRQAPAHHGLGREHLAAALTGAADARFGVAVRPRPLHLPRLPFCPAHQLRHHQAHPQAYWSRSLFAGGLPISEPQATLSMPLPSCTRSSPPSAFQYHRQNRRAADDCRLPAPSQAPPATFASRRPPDRSSGARRITVRVVMIQCRQSQQPTSCCCARWRPIILGFAIRLLDGRHISLDLVTVFNLREQTSTGALIADDGRQPRRLQSARPWPALLQHCHPQMP